MDGLGPRIDTKALSDRVLQGIELPSNFRRGFDVLELVGARDAQGRLKVVDVFDLMSGELKSQEIRRLTLPILAETDRSLADRLLGKERVFAPHKEGKAFVKRWRAAHRE